MNRIKNFFFKLGEPPLSATMSDGYLKYERDTCLVLGYNLELLSLVFTKCKMFFTEFYTTEAIKLDDSVFDDTWQESRCYY